jgi:tetratricopeptide (TPR) repeat protein
MKFPIVVIAMLIAATGTTPALADWACARTSVLKSSFTKGQSLEKSGKLREALSAYVAAQSNACAGDPVAAEAAKRAAAVALPLGDAARAQGNHELAFELYESGGHYAAAPIPTTFRSTKRRPRTSTNATCRRLPLTTPSDLV